MNAAMNDWVVLAGSAVVVAVMAIVARAMGFRVKGRFVDAAAVRDAVRRVDPRAEVQDVAIDGAWAIARLGDGRLALARAMGDGATARVLAPTAPRPRVKPGKKGVRVIVRGLDVGFPGGVLRLSSAPEWLAGPSGKAP